MDEILKGWGRSVKEYWTDGRSAAIIDWWYLPAAVLAVWALAILLRLVIRKSKYPFKTIYTVHRRIAIASAILGAGFLFWMISCWGTKYYDTHPVRFIHLLTFLELLVLPVISLLMLRSYYRREKLREIAEHPRTKYQQEKIQDQTRKGFTRLKLWGLFVVAGYLGLLIWGFKQDKNLISVVVDNSYSMDEAIKNGKIALGNTFKGLGENTDIVLTSFTMKTAKTLDSYEQIVASKKFNVVSVSNFFETPDAALAPLNNIAIETQVGSPIVQMIWENYQFVKRTCPVDEYKKRLLLIVTDGGDNYINASLAKSNNWLCSNSDFDNVFAAENVRIIDVGGAYEKGNMATFVENGPPEVIQLFDKANKCGYDIRNGTELEDYSQAVNDALREFKKDWWFIASTGLIYVLYLLSLLFISPRRQ